MRQYGANICGNLDGYRTYFCSYGRGRPSLGSIVVTCARGIKIPEGVQELQTHTDNLLGWELSQRTISSGGDESVHQRTETEKLNLRKKVRCLWGHSNFSSYLGGLVDARFFLDEATEKSVSQRGGHLALLTGRWHAGQSSRQR